MRAVARRRRPAEKGKRAPRVPGNRVVIRTYLTEEQAAKAKKMADLHGISVSAYIAALISRDHLGADGKPTWTPTEIAHADQLSQQELDLSAA